MSTPPFALPIYIDEQNYENFNNELNQTLREWFNWDGFLAPSLDAGQVTIISAYKPIGTFWYNSTLDKLQFLGSGGVQTVTSV